MRTSVDGVDVFSCVEQISCNVYEQLCEHPAVFSDPLRQRAADQAFAALSRLSRLLADAAGQAPANKPRLRTS